MQNASTLNTEAGLISEMPLSDRIQIILDAGHKKVDLARAAGKSPSAVSLWLNGVTKEIKADSAAGIQAMTGFSAVWLATGKGPRRLDEIPNVAPGPKIGGTVQVLSSVQAGNFREHIDNYHAMGSASDTVATSAPVNRYTFAMRVHGDSMEPEFSEGTILIVEPELDPRPSDYVIVKNGSDEATFKQLIRDGADWLLKPLNPRYPIKTMTKDMRIVGVVRASERRFR